MPANHKCSIYTDMDIERVLFDQKRDLRSYPWGDISFHDPEQDCDSEAWKTLLTAIEDTAASGKELFQPLTLIGAELWKQIKILPPTISKLTRVKILALYGSNLVQIPPEIGKMQSLENLDIYCSYGLHWLPYEITQCAQLRYIRVSIRALYGNVKFRPPFPKLPSDGHLDIPASVACSVCGATLQPPNIRQFWISLPVGGDVLPLLVNACSKECISTLPKPPDGYIGCPHKGGSKQKQPKPGLPQKRPPRKRHRA